MVSNSALRYLDCNAVAMYSASFSLKQSFEYKRVVSILKPGVQGNPGEEVPVTFREVAKCFPFVPRHGNSGSLRYSI